MASQFSFFPTKPKPVAPVPKFDPDCGVTLHVLYYDSFTGAHVKPGCVVDGVVTCYPTSRFELKIELQWPLDEFLKRFRRVG